MCGLVAYGTYTVEISNISTFILYLPTQLRRILLDENLTLHDNHRYEQSDKKRIHLFEFYVDYFCTTNQKKHIKYDPLSLFDDE